MNPSPSFSFRSISTNEPRFIPMQDYRAYPTDAVIPPPSPGPIGQILVQNPAILTEQFASGAVPTSPYPFRQYLIGNVSKAEAGWTAKVLVDWLDVYLTDGPIIDQRYINHSTPGLGIPVGGSVSITLALNSRINLLVPGSYSDDLKIVDSSSGIGTTLRLANIVLT